eukprot:3179854-Rhodomonas_salina.3
MQLATQQGSINSEHASNPPTKPCSPQGSSPPVLQQHSNTANSRSNTTTMESRRADAGTAAAGLWRAMDAVALAGGGGVARPRVLEPSDY